VTAPVVDLGLPSGLRPSRLGLLAVGHGTRDPEGAAVVRALVRRVGDLAPDLDVRDAYVDNAPPSVGSALDALAADGVGQASVVPLLLTAASHSKGDLAGSVQASRLRNPGLRLAYGRPLGPHPALLTTLADRLAEAGAGPDRDDTGVVLAAVGALDPDGNAEVVKTARLLWEGRSWPYVEAAFLTATRPGVGEVVRRLARLGVRRVALAPYAIAPGLLPRKAAEQAREAADAEGLELVVAAPLGLHDALAGLVLERHREALGSDIRMNCDVCAYRVPFPGYEGRVGAAQEPHTHPDEEPAED
jgi:sirohydrochlorin cobaltochelatase